MSAPSSNGDASMVGGHAQYIKGYVSETIGSVTGSKEWVDSGKQDQEGAIDEMKVSFAFSWESQRSHVVARVCMLGVTPGNNDVLWSRGK